MRCHTPTVDMPDEREHQHPVLELQDGDFERIHHVEEPAQLLSLTLKGRIFLLQGRSLIVQVDALGLGLGLCGPHNPDYLLQQEASNCHPLNQE